ncbi:hypoxanthine phosphoribosyltransferase [Pleomorphomonas sp. SM30]|uniref:Hypoxanthine phosphoribosyltransferase n=2 Tax=Oharaeibacter diazotrophicus TaxID=1920512 RepID=A0A4R6REI6_9HYPH|nr:hypoxanthine phosphoribosyltransferase [Oharaeibacter diazotrophicus]BBE73125.1 hypoxanthine phosphoribosyltransferase [Pleomorphomonas sp. SM30]
MSALREKMVSEGRVLAAPAVSDDRPRVGHAAAGVSMSGRKIDVLYSEDAIAGKVDWIAGEVAGRAPRRLLVIAILKGSFMFAADLLRALHRRDLAPEVEFMMLSSYGTGTVSSGTVRVVRDIDTDVAGRDVLIIDDILESGRTLAFARALMIERGAARVDVAVLLEKPGKRKAEIEADLVGFVCPDKFVVGYGMDAAHAYRELPFVGVVREDGDG